MDETARGRTELVAVVLGLETGPGGMSRLGVLTSGDALPSGPLQADQSLQRGLRHWVESLTGYRLGHTEQLYTFADKSAESVERVVRISYMTLARPSEERQPWPSVYDFFPWEDRRGEDRRDGDSLALLAGLGRHLKSWAGHDPARRERCAVAFAFDDCDWNDELVLTRYELLWEAGLLPESPLKTGALAPGRSLSHDHRRILATALSRIRAKIRYTPAVFDLLPEHFTLLQLQQAMEALAGRPMHKQNFRRLVQHQGLVEETAAFDPGGQGRPARLYRFRPEAGQDCYLAGAKLPLPSGNGGSNTEPRHR